ncbi:enoyl-CoA hydratase-related protein [Oligoflexia bacterium]|nr:enoyl-CoA hydratase-related protein [Oligoflexia bacterium]
MSISEETVRYRVSDGIAAITINRPEQLNALNTDVLKSLMMDFEQIEKNDMVRAITITGAGEKAFVAGADIPMLQQLGVHAASDYIELGQRAMRCIEHASVPVIAVVNGYALGGGLELALACDLVCAGSGAKFGLPEVGLGVIPGFGGTQRLIQRSGIGAARRIVLTGEIIDAAEALNIGLADLVVEDEELPDRARALAAGIVSKGPLAVCEAKRLIRRSQESQLLSGLQMEVESFLKVFDTADREEGMLAFMQKRQPNFEGK